MADQASPVAQRLHRVLTSAPAMRTKRRIRDAFWVIRGRSFQNPPWPARVDAMLFICYGNICRSPFAAKLASQRLARKGFMDIRCSSAGFRTSQLAVSPPDAVTVAHHYGVSLKGHRPTLITEALIKSHDAIFVMEPVQLAQLRRRWPAESQRFFLLTHFDGPEPRRGAYERLHLVDPFGRGEAAFVEAYARIARAVDGVIANCLGRRR